MTAVINDSLLYYKPDKTFVNIDGMPVTVHCMLYNGLQYVIKLWSILKLYYL